MFNPSSILTVAYIGAPYTQDHRLCNPLPPGEKPQLVPLSFIWSSYGVSQANPNAAASVDLSSFGLQKFSAVRGCYIDNTGSDGSIFVYFPDTGFAITCAPFSTAWSPVLTNGVACTVAGKGFGTADGSTTKVFLLNVPVNPDESAEINYVYPQWRASPTLSRGINIYSSGFASPAIGDQWQEFTLTGINGTASQALFGSPYLQGGTLTVTDLDISYGGSAAGAAALSTLKIQSNGVSGVLIEKNFGANGFTANGFSGPVAGPISGLQYKLNAAETWAATLLSTTAYTGNGKLFCRIGFSYQGTGTGQIGQNTGNISTLAFAKTGAQAITSALRGGFKFASAVNGVVNSVSCAFTFGFVGSNSTHIEIWTDNAGSPGALIGSSDNVAIAGSSRNIAFPFSTPVAIANGTNYWAVCVTDLAAGLSWDTYQAVDAFASGKNAVITAIAAGGGMVNANEKFKIEIDYLY